MKGKKALNVEPIVNAMKNPDRFPYSYSTMRRFHALKEHPDLIFKVHGRLFFSWDVWGDIVEEAQQKSVNR